MNTATIPALHICVLCHDNVASGTYESGIPRACSSCEDRVRLAKLARIYEPMNAEAIARRAKPKFSLMKFVAVMALSAGLAFAIIVWALQ